MHWARLELHVDTLNGWWAPAAAAYFLGGCASQPPTYTDQPLDFTRTSQANRPRKTTRSKN